MARTDHHVPKALARERTWEAHDDADQVREWTVDPSQGVLQGPLDLAFFAGHRLVLHLAEHQVGLLERDGDLKGVFLAGTHHLQVGDGPRETAPGRLTFVHMDEPISWRWRDDATLWIDGPGCVRCPIPFIGACSLTVTGPVAFWESFLRGVPSFEPPFLRQVLDTLVRSRLEAHLTQLAADRAVDPVTVQTLLADLRADCLTDDLEDFGLVCTNLATYTRQPPVTEQVSEATGQFVGPDDNNR